MATWNQPHQQAAPETACLASGLAALDSAEFPAVERVDLRRNNSAVHTVDSLWLHVQDLCPKGGRKGVWLNEIHRAIQTHIHTWILIVGVAEWK